MRLLGRTVAFGKGLETGLEEGARLRLGKG